MIEQLQQALAQDGMVALIVAAVGCLVKVTEVLLKRQQGKRPQHRETEDRLDRLELLATIEQQRETIAQLRFRLAMAERESGAPE